MSTAPRANRSEAIPSFLKHHSPTASTSRRFDDRFFVAMSIFILCTVFLGFARTYYLAGIYHTHLPNLLIHVHAALFTTWILLFIVQTGLVARRQVALHRRLGVFGAVLAASMVIVGLAAATDSLSRGFAPPGFPLGPLGFYAQPVFSIATFGILIGAGLWMRSNGSAHKRLVLLATIILLDAAISRWPFSIIRREHFLVNVVVDLMVLAIVAFDLWSLRRIHRATLLGGLFLIVMLHFTFPVGATSAWQRFADFALRFWQGWH